jgi:RimJ/RimL family protein N-acetyltransferase
MGSFYRTGATTSSATDAGFFSTRDILITMNVRELMRFHVEALFAHDVNGRLLRGNEPSGAEAPRFFLGRTADGPVIRFRHDLDDDTRHELEAAANDDAVNATLESEANPSPFEEILGRTAPVRNTWLGPAFSFPAESSESIDAVHVTNDNAQVLNAFLRDWIPDIRIGQPLFAQIVGGNAVAVCCTVRRTSDAHEAGVETVPAFRGHGYAAQVVAAWARAVREGGQTPLYSTSWQNEASRAVARKLGLIQFGNDLHIT